MPTRSPTANAATPVPSRFDVADDFMARDQRQVRLRQFAVDDVQVGAAHAAGVDPHQHLVRGGPGHVALDRASAERGPR